MPPPTRLLAGRGGRERTLRHQLVVLLILFTVGPLVLTNAWGYLQSRRFFASTKLESVRDVAGLEATGVLRFVQSKYRLATSIVAGNQHLFGLLRALGTPDPKARVSVLHALVANLEAKAKENEAIEEFYVLSPEGRLLASSRPHPTGSGDAGASLCFRRGRQVAAIDGIDYEGARPALLLSAPIVDTQSRFLGVFCTRVGFDLPGGLALGHHPGNGLARLTLLGPDGRVVDQAPARPDDLGRPLADGSPTWHFGRTAFAGRYLTARHRDVIAAYAPIPELGWGILVESPVKAAMASLDALKWQAAFFALLLTTLVVLAVFVMARRIADPLMALADAARRAASGALGVSVPPGGTVEIADLARSFNRMSVAVKDSHDLLEHRITERTQALQTSQEFAERLLDSIAQPVVVIDPDLKVVKANPAALARYGDGIVGTAYEDRFACEAGGSDTASLRSVFETHRAANVERLETSSDGEDVVNLQMFPVLSQGGEVEAVIQLRRVVTDERRLQAQMINQEKMSAFGIVAAGVAHEIGNPLASMESQLRLAREAPAPGRVEETLEIVTREVQRIARLLRELVSFARRREEGPMRISVTQVLRDVARLLENDPRAKKVTVRVRADDGAAVSATEDHLIQVFLNLGLNALDAMASGGTLAFEVSEEGGRVTVRVRDTGGGVNGKALGHLFEPFFTTKDPGRGTGLGLFVSKGIVEGLDGTLTLEHTGPDGSVFRIDLPMAQRWSPRRAS